MIQANELRIGNILKPINSRYNEQFIVVENIALDEVNYNFKPYSLDALQPIPITPEILEKCGFKQVVVFEGINTNVYELNKFEIGRDGLDFVNMEMTIIIDKSLTLKVKYLHELQNIYYWYTNKQELKITLP